MVQRRVLFLHEDKDLPQLLEKELNGANSWAVAFEPLGRAHKPQDHHPYDLVVLESKKGWATALQQIQHHQISAHAQPLMAIPGGLLRKDCRRVIEAVEALLEDSDRSGRGPGRHPARGLPSEFLLQDIIERKFKEFVKKLKVSQARNLHTLLLKEIERPFISLILKETNGNQIQAALILGMNRNTLRKKIRELKIPLKRKSPA